ncbi:MAG: penicillin-binding protein 2 [Bryobacterales bacterium]|nr:penicillin-binding protein 2 [Bryobacterales bacterium]
MPPYQSAHDREKDKEPEAFHVLRDDATFASSRILFFQYFALAIVSYLSLGYWNLQIRQGDYYLSLAERNRIRSYPMLAPRGKMLDREGRVVVDNNSAFSLMVSRDAVTPEQIRAIAPVLQLDFDEVMERVRRFDKSKASRAAPVTLKENLTRAELAYIEAHRGDPEFRSLEITQDHRRVYPRGGFSAHVLGYTGEVSERELDTVEFARYRPGDVIGKAGLEKQYNDLLMGIDGQRRVIVDYNGNERELLDKKEPMPGRSIQLTLDLDLQAVAELALRDRRGAVVAIDPRSGEVLAMVSGPSYDPNRFAGRIRRKDWDEIRNNPDNPLFNRAVQAALAPGSTFKPIMALAGLETGTIGPDAKAFCRGGGTYYGSFRKCHSTHGEVDFTRALQASCDVFFYELGDRLRIDRIADYAQMAGFGRRTGIDLPSEVDGIVPSTRWKVRTFRKRWFVGETISVAIGQGALIVTPLQLAHAIGGMAMGGVWHEPHLLKQVMGEATAAPKPARKVAIDSTNLGYVLAGMSAAVNLPGGTAHGSMLQNVEMCGKTGTAQLMSNALAQARREAIKRGATGLAPVEDNAWFVGFAPRQNPEIVVAALYEGGAHGDRAAPIVRDVIKAYFDKKKPAERPKQDPLVTAFLYDEAAGARPQP